MDKVSSCCFVGHRSVSEKTKVKEIVCRIVENLVTVEGVRVFKFGSNSEFDNICYAVVTELQKRFPDIIRENYRVKSEYVVMSNEKEKLEWGLSRLLKTSVNLRGFEVERVSDRVLVAGKASYIERNQEMIDDSQYCVFFYCKNYAPKSGKSSGAKLAYNYAIKKGKQIINVAEF